MLGFKVNHGAYVVNLDKPRPKAAGENTSSHLATSAVQKSSWAKESQEGREANEKNAPEKNKEVKDNPRSLMQVGESGTDLTHSSGGNQYFPTGNNENEEEQDAVMLSEESDVKKETKLPGLWKGELQFKPVPLEVWIRLSKSFLRAYTPTFSHLLCLVSF